MLTQIPPMSPPPAPDCKAIARRQRRKLAVRVLLNMIEAGHMSKAPCKMIAETAVGMVDHLETALKSELGSEL